jgi:hypothetical protein
LWLLDTRDGLFDDLDARTDDALLVLECCKRRALNVKKIVDAAFVKARKVAAERSEEIPEEILAREHDNWKVSRCWLGSDTTEPIRLSGFPVSSDCTSFEYGLPRISSLAKT